jgi:hypothetical protein
MTSLIDSMAVPALQDIDAVEALLRDRPARTRTYRVTMELLAAIDADGTQSLRTLDDRELLDLADLLGVAANQVAGPFRVVDAACPSCARRISFVDFVQTAARSSVDDIASRAAVLTGQVGAWITIRGRDGGRAVTCTGCGRIARDPAGYSEYSSKTYAYA